MLDTASDVWDRWREIDVLLRVRVLGTAALLKRQNSLHLGQLHLQDGWGLDFTAKLCSWLIVSVQILDIVAALLVAISLGIEDEKRLSLVLSGGFILAIGQSVATLMQSWAERNLGETSKPKGKG